MIFSAEKLLRKLKKAQITEDGQIYIDFDALTVSTVHGVNEPCKCIKLKKFRGSIHSVLAHLKDLGFVEYDDFGQAKVTYRGWTALSADIQEAVKFTVRDVIIPIIVSVITSIIVSRII